VSFSILNVNIQPVCKNQELGCPQVKLYYSFVVEVFSLVQEEYYEPLASEFVDIDSQLDIVTDILTRDGHCIAKIDWFAKLYESELGQLKSKLTEFKSIDT
jgi:hypothetical protein